MEGWREGWREGRGRMKEQPGQYAAVRSQLMLSSDDAFGGTRRPGPDLQEHIYLSIYLSLSLYIYIYIHIHTYIHMIYYALNEDTNSVGGNISCLMYSLLAAEPASVKL